MEEIEEGLKEGWLKEAEDPFALTREPTPEEKEHRDRLWEQLKDALLDEPGIFDKHTRSRHLKRIESKGGERCPTCTVIWAGTGKGERHRTPSCRVSGPGEGKENAGSVTAGQKQERNRSLGSRSCRRT